VKELREPQGCSWLPKEYSSFISVLLESCLQSLVTKIWAASVDTFDSTDGSFMWTGNISGTALETFALVSSHWDTPHGK
jgi:hypothetical protein